MNGLQLNEYLNQSSVKKKQKLIRSEKRIFCFFHELEFNFGRSRWYISKLGGVSKSMLTLNEAIIDVKKG